MYLITLLEKRPTAGSLFKVEVQRRRQGEKVCRRRHTAKGLKESAPPPCLRLQLSSAIVKSRTTQNSKALCQNVSANTGTFPVHSQFSELNDHGSTNS